MPKPTWPVIAAAIKREYIEGGKCKICKEEIVKGEELPFKQLLKIYKHFAEKHKDVIDKVKVEVRKKPTVQLLTHVVFPKVEEKEEEAEVGVEVEEK